MGADPTQETLETIRTLVAAGKSSRQIAEHLGTHTRRQVQDLVTKHDLGTWATRLNRSAIPADFQRRFEDGELLATLAAFYNRSPATICSWAKQLGLSRPVPTTRASRKTQDGKSVPFTRNHYAARPVDRPYREESAAGDAQAYLQADRPVYRLGPDLWQCGSLKLTNDELVAKAAEVRGRRERLMAGRVA